MCGVSGAAAALSPELAEAYRALATRGRALSREDFARARGLAAEAAAGHPDDREAVFLRDFSAAAIDFADGNQANAILLLRRAVAAAPIRRLKRKTNRRRTNPKKTEIA